MPGSAQRWRKLIATIDAKSAFAGLLLFGGLGGGGVISAIILFRTTRNYFRLRGTVETED